MTNKIKLSSIILCFWLMVIFGSSCKEDAESIMIEPFDTTSMSFSKRGLLIDTRTSGGLEGAKVFIYSKSANDSIQLISSSNTDSNGLFHFNFNYYKYNSGFTYVFEHPNPVFMKRTYPPSFHQEKINDSTELFYLHRKSGCKISLKNRDGKQKNVMLFNSDKKFSKLLMNLRSDTVFYYLLQDYEDKVFFDYFPQRSLQSMPVRGSTSGDTVSIEFKY